MAKTMTGIVASDKANKTIVVKIVSHRTHPIYKKKYLVTKRIMAHDEANEANIGDKVVIVETRPISSNKHFSLQEIVEKAVIEHREDEVVMEKPKKVENTAKKSATETDTEDEA